MQTTSNEFRGTRYNPDLNRVAIAKLARADIKAAIASGELPAGIKVSVTCHGNSISASIVSFPGPVLNRARVYGDALGFWEQRTRLLYTAPVRKALSTLDAILCAYLRDSSDSSTDYFSCNFYNSVQCRCDTRTERETLLASDELADLRVTKAAGCEVFGYLEALDTSGGDEYRRCW